MDSSVHARKESVHLVITEREMTSVVSGAGLGVGLSSFGEQGLGLGSALVGRAGLQSSYVNGQSGNLVVQIRDEILVGLGQDVGVLRTYNSQGSLDGDNNDGWRIGFYRQIIGLTGVINTAGSSVRRVGEDGAESTYQYDSASGNYISTDGGGAHDTLQYSSSTGRWTWTEGSSRARESYDWDGAQGFGKLLTSQDIDGNTTTYTYGGTGLLSRVLNASGESVWFTYDANKNLTKIHTTDAAGVVTGTSTYYEYDTSNRLIKVKVDLSPENSSLSDGKAYITNYTYDGASTRLASITQSDGSTVVFTYALVGGQYAITNIAEGDLGQRQTAIAYNQAGKTVSVTDANGNLSSLQYDSSGRITRLTEGDGGFAQYAYDAQGNLISVTDAEGQQTVYQYDANGNRTLSRGVLGDTIAYTYDGANRLIHEIRYAGIDPDGAGAGQPTQGNGRRTIYDGEGHVRFVIDFDGGVTRYDYNGNGTLAYERQYWGGKYNVSGAVYSQTEAQAWWDGLVDKSQGSLTAYVYDFRGQLTLKREYGYLNPDGTSNTSGAASAATTNAGASSRRQSTQYVYDQRGRLLQTIEADTFESAVGRTTSYVYDGLGRLTASTDTLGRTSTISYEDSNKKIVTTGANGLVTVDVYNDTGELLRTVRGISGDLDLYGITYYAYDVGGRLRMQTDATGAKTYWLYDAADRKVAEIQADGGITGLGYDKEGRQIFSRRYYNRVSAANLAALVDVNGAPTNATLASVLPAVNTAYDQISWTLYDQAGRLAKTIDAQGYVTERQYDGRGRHIKTIRYATGIGVTNLAALSTSSKAWDAAVTVATNTGDRIHRYFYDAADQLVGELDAEGYLTRHAYSLSGQKIFTQRYLLQVAAPGSANFDADFSILVGIGEDQEANDRNDWYYYDGRGLLRGHVIQAPAQDAAGNLAMRAYLTEYIYDSRGNRTQQIQYATALSITPSTITTVGTLRPSSAPQDQVITWVYDDFSRVASETDDQGSITQYTYEAGSDRVVKTERAFGTAEVRTYAAVYDKLGRVLKELSGEGHAKLEALGANPTQAQIDSVWSNYGIVHRYDLMGRKVQSTDANGLKTWHYYDDVGRLRYRVNHAGDLVTYDYYGNGLLQSERRHGLQLSTAGLTGGSASVLEATVYALTTAVDWAEVYTYDNRAQRTMVGRTRGETVDPAAYWASTYNTFGELSQLIDAVGSISTYAYDKRGLQLSQTEAVGNTYARTTSTQYDGFGRVTSTTDGNGVSRTFGYDGQGREIVRTDGKGYGATTVYDRFGRTIKEIDRMGATTTYAYDKTTRTITITHPDGVVVTQSQNRYGQTIKVSQNVVSDTGVSETRYIETTYNKDGQVATLKNNAGVQETNVYEDNGWLFTSTNEAGQVTSYSYDGAGRMLSRTVDHGGLNLVTTWTYDGRGNKLTETNPAGQQIVYTYNRAGDLKSITRVRSEGDDLVTQYTYDTLGKRLTVTEGSGAEARVSAYLYDKLGRLTSESIDPLGLNIQTQYDYDANDNLTRRTDALGYTTHYVYDAQNQLTYTVDAAGYVSLNSYDKEGRINRVWQYATAISKSGWAAQVSATTVTANLVSSGQDRAQYTSYDVRGRVQVTWGRNYDQVVRRYYDDAGNEVAVRSYAKALSGPPATYAQADVLAKIQADDDEDRLVRKVYDAANRLRWVIDAEGYVIRNDYDHANNIWRTVTYASKVILSAAAAVAEDLNQTEIGVSGSYRLTHYYHDDANRLRYEVRTDQNGNNGEVKRYEYNGAGQLTYEFTYAARENIGSSSSFDAMTTLMASKSSVYKYYVYDSAGRLITLRERDGGLINYTYDSLDRKVTENGDATVDASYQYDKAGRLLEHNTLNGTAELFDENYTYDKLGRVLSHTNARGYVTTYAYDVRGNKISETNPLGGASTWQYNAFGEVVKSVNPLGATTWYYTAFDGGNDHAFRLTLNPLGYAVREDLDAFGNVVKRIQYLNAATGTGSISTLPTVDSSNIAQTTYTYNKRNLLTQTVDALGYDEDYGYDGYGNRTTFTNKVDGTTTYVYDHVGQVISETLPITTLNSSGVSIAVVNQYSYDGRGNRIQTIEAVGSPEARTTDYTYDGLGRVTYKTVDPDGSISTHYTQYDKLGNITGKRDPNGYWSVYYYDAANRKTGEFVGVQNVAASHTMGRWSSFAYDAAGNLTTARQYDALVRLDDSNPATNTVGIDVGIAPSIAGGATYRETTYSYDALNRQVSATQVADWTVTNVGGATAADKITANYTVGTTTTYDAVGNVIRQTPAGTAMATVAYYDLLGRKTLEIDRLGYGVYWIYGAQDGAIQEYRYSAALSGDTLATIKSNPQALSASTVRSELSANSGSDSIDNRAIKYTYDKLGRVSKKEVMDAYIGDLTNTGGSATAAGTLSLSATDRTLTTTYTYNGLGNLTSEVVNALDSNGVALVLDHAQEYTQTYTYDKMGRRTAEYGHAFKDFAGTWRRDQTDTIYNGLSNVRSTTGQSHLGSQDRVTTYTYDKVGRVVTETDAMGYVTSYTYDDVGNVLRQDRARQIYDRSSGSPVLVDTVTDSTTYTYNGWGQELTRTDLATGTVWATEYNSHGQVSKRYVNGALQSWTEYDNRGQVWRTNHEDGVVRAYLYDSVGNALYKMESGTQNLRAMTATAMLDSTAVAVTRSGYDKNRRLVAVYEPTFNQAVEAASVSIANTQDVPAPVTDSRMLAASVGGVSPKYSLWIDDKTVNGSNQYEGGLMFKMDVPNANAYDELGKGPYRLHIMHITGSSEYYLESGQTSLTGKIQYLGNSAASQVDPDDDGFPGDTILRASLWKQTDTGAEILVDQWDSGQLSGGGSNLVMSDTKLRAGSALTAATAANPLTSDTLGTRVTSQLAVTSHDVHFANQPAGATQLKLYTRVKGSTGAWLENVAAPVQTKINSDQFMWGKQYGGTGHEAPTWFALNLAGDLTTGTTYEYYYVALNGSNQLVNLAKGELTSSASTSGRVVVHSHDPYAPGDLGEMGTSQALPWDTARTFTIAAGKNLSRLVRNVSSTATQAVNIVRSQAYNAFGEIISSTDGLGNTTTYEYNNAGVLFRRTDPGVSNAKADGTTEAGFKPIAQYYSDLFGRTVGVAQKIDGGWRWNYQSWQRIGGQDRIALEQFADGGQIWHRHDMLGNEVNVIDQSGNNTRKDYDKLGRLGLVEYANNREDRYGYDSAGNRVWHTEVGTGGTAQASSVWDYDSLGRMTRAVDVMGRSTGWSYSWKGSTNTYAYGGRNDALDDLAQGGWQTVETRPDYRIQTKLTDTWGRQHYQKDMGGIETRSTFDQAGRQTLQVNTVGQELKTSYYANGYVKDQLDTRYRDMDGSRYVGYKAYNYNQRGDRVREVALEGWRNPGNTGWYTGIHAPYYLQDTELSYDALGRLTQAEDAQSVVNYSYDAVGNRRKMSYAYTDLLYTGTDTSKKNLNITNWYTYDSMDRMIIADGDLVSGVIKRNGDKGVALAYNSAGDRTEVIYTKDGKTFRENYYYNNVHLLTSTIGSYWQSGVGWSASRTLNTRSYDTLNRVTTNTTYGYANDTTTTFNKQDISTIGYRGDNSVDSRVDTGFDGSSTQTSWVRTRHQYQLDGSLRSAQSLYGSGPNNLYQNLTHTRYTYQWRNQALQQQVIARNTGQNTTSWDHLYQSDTGYATRYMYDVNGNVARMRDVQGNRTDRYMVDARGQVQRRTENVGAAAQTYRTYQYANSQIVGDFGNDLAGNKLSVERKYSEQGAGSAQDRQAMYRDYQPTLGSSGSNVFDPINNDFPLFAPTKYTAQGGETLQQVAQNVWGDPGLWYLIADANGLIGASTLTAGQVLTIPNRVTNVHNNASTFKPYSQFDTLGDTSPTVPSPPPPAGKGGCGGMLLTVVIVVVAAVAAFYTSGATLALLNPASAAAATTAATTTAAAAATTAAATTAAATTAATVASAVAAGAVAGVTSSVVSQGLSMAVGLQDKFSWRGVGISALTSAVTAGVGEGLGQYGLNAELGKPASFRSAAVNFGKVALRTAISQTATQGAMMALGLQKRMDWRGVAINSVAAGVATVGADVIGDLTDAHQDGSYNGKLLENLDQSNAWLNVASHALLGAGVATIAGRDAASGAVGGAFEAAFGGYATSVARSFTSNSRYTTEIGAGITKIAAAAIADIFGMRQPQTAAAAADNAYRNNSTRFRAIQQKYAGAQSKTGVRKRINQNNASAESVASLRETLVKINSSKGPLREWLEVKISYINKIGGDTPLHELRWELDGVKTSDGHVFSVNNDLNSDLVALSNDAVNDLMNNKDFAKIPFSKEEAEHVVLTALKFFNSFDDLAKIDRVESKFRDYVGFKNLSQIAGEKLSNHCIFFECKPSNQLDHFVGVHNKQFSGKNTFETFQFIKEGLARIKYQEKFDAYPEKVDPSFERYVSPSDRASQKRHKKLMNNLLGIGR
jgi:YD repeat-containing protein